MNRNVAARSPLFAVPAPLASALALGLAVGLGLLITELLMAPPAGEMRDLAAYLTFSGAATLGAGWALLRFADRGLRLSIRARTFWGATIGSGVALLNVLIVAQLMFVSTSHDLKLLLALVAFSGVMVAFFTIWAASAVSSRIEAVASGIRALAEGDYQTRLGMAGADEVARLAEDVDTLARRLHRAGEERAALDRERRDLTVAISHDLRTPLASVRAMVEALDDRVVCEPEEVARYHAVIRREVDRLSRMIDDLFELARIDSGALKLDLGSVSLVEVAAEVVDAMQAQARRAGVALALDVAGPVPELPLDGARIERAVANLVRNALEHTPADGRVDVRLAAENGAVLLSVSDTGDGIEASDLPRVWDRFYRAEKSRNRPADGGDGAGLGLAIVRGIVEAHGGAVDARSSPGQGAAFVVRLPRQRA
ncbi:MAG: HAMP domain-containing sensor histidine kinase [Dehalococcoidia bacterium]